MFSFEKLFAVWAVSQAPIVFSRPAFPPPGSTGASDPATLAPCVVANQISCALTGFTISLSDPCPYRPNKLCEFWDGQDVYNKDVEFSIYATCQNPGASNGNLRIPFADYAAAIGYVSNSPTCEGLTAHFNANFLNGNATNTAAYKGPGQFICPSEFVCPLRTSARRSLSVETLEGQSFDGTEEEIQKLFNRCGEFEYEAQVHVTKAHLYALGIPGNEALENQCPFFMMNGLIGDSEDPKSTFSRKEIKIWRNRKDFERSFSPDGSFSFGDFPASKMMEAYHAAELTTPGFHAYDVVKNNCATFLLNLGAELGIEIDSHVKSFVARRLFEQGGKKLVDGIRRNTHFSSLIGGHDRKLRGESIEGDELVMLLVEQSASGLLS